MSLIDSFAKKSRVSRICYGHDEDNKPNNHCYWTRLSADLWGWVEDDESFRNRVKNHFQENE